MYNTTKSGFTLQMHGILWVRNIRKRGIQMHSVYIYRYIYIYTTPLNLDSLGSTISAKEHYKPAKKPISPPKNPTHIQHRQIWIHLGPQPQIFRIQNVPHLRIFSYNMLFENNIYVNKYASMLLICMKYSYTIREKRLKRMERDL